MSSLDPFSAIDSSSSALHLSHWRSVSRSSFLPTIHSEEEEICMKKKKNGISLSVCSIQSLHVIRTNDCVFDDSIIIIIVIIGTNTIIIVIIGPNTIIIVVIIGTS